MKVITRLITFISLNNESMMVVNTSFFTHKKKNQIKSIHHRCCTHTHTHTLKIVQFFSCGVVTVARCHGAHVQEGRWVVVDVVTLGLRCLK